MAQACEQLAEALPRKLDAVPRQATDPQSPFTAAWGKPAIVLRCGIERPAVLDGTPLAAEIDGVGWAIEDLPDGHRFTSTGRAAYVQVFVPDDYAPEVNPLVDLSPAMRAAVPEGRAPGDAGETPGEDGEGGEGGHPDGEHPGDEHSPGDH